MMRKEMMGWKRQVNIVYACPKETMIKSLNTKFQPELQQQQISSNSNAIIPS
jgi:hypothetical protein